LRKRLQGDFATSLTAAALVVFETLNWGLSLCSLALLSPIREDDEGEKSAIIQILIHIILFFVN